MDRLSIYRGMAGEIVIGFLSPGTLFTSIPVILFFAFWALVIAFVPGLAESGFGALLLMLVSSYVVGRFVQPAREGHLNEGWFSPYVNGKEAWSYALHYFAAVILSGAPILIGALFLVAKMFGGLGLGGGLGSVMGAGLSGALIMLLIILIAMDMVLAYLMAAWSDSYGDLMGLNPWIYLWHRRGDVAMFFVAGLGGVIAFWLVYFVPMLLLGALVALFSEEAGFAVLGWAMMLPAALSPVLFGRLVGGFVAGEGEFDPEQRPLGDLSPEAEAALAANRSGADPAAAAAAAAASGAAQSNPEPAPSAPAAAGTAPPAAEPGAETTSSTTTSTTSVTVSAFTKDHVAATVQSVKEVPDDGVDLALERARTAFQNDSHDLVAAVRFGMLSLRKEDFDSAIRALRLAVSELVAERSGGAAVQLYQALGKNRTRLGLDKMTLEGLARVLKLQGKYLDAGWCLYAAWLPSNPQNAQNHLTMVGLEAAQKEAWEDVQKIFRFLLQKHPDSSFKDQAEASLAKAEQELAVRRHRDG
jgi:hypothetical protein